MTDQHDDPPNDPATDYGPYPGYHPIDEVELMPHDPEKDGPLPQRMADRRAVGALGREVVTAEHEASDGDKIQKISDDHQRRVNQIKALELRLAGLAASEIAEQLKVTNNTVYKYLRDARQLAIATIAEDVRDIELIRLALLDRTFWPMARTGDHKAAKIVLGGMERRAKMLGLDAPSRVRFEHVVQREFDDIVAESGLAPELLQAEVDRTIDEAEYEIRR